MVSALFVIACAEILKKFILCVVVHYTVTPLRRSDYKKLVNQRAFVVARKSIIVQSVVVLSVVSSAELPRQLVRKPVNASARRCPAIILLLFHTLIKSASRFLALKLLISYESLSAQKQILPRSIPLPPQFGQSVHSLCLK